MNTKEFVIVHHSDIHHDGRAQFGRIDNGHRARKFPKSSLGYYVGYHFVIEEDGTIIAGRTVDERGAHSDNCGCSTDVSGVPKGMINFRSIGICLAGDFTMHAPSSAQITSMHDLVWSLQSAGARFLLHREVKNTSCPGVDLRVYYEMEHTKFQKKELERKKKALRWATESRRPALQRAINRLATILLPPLPSHV